MYYESKINTSINTFKMLIFYFFKASGSTFFHLHQRLLMSFMSFKEAAFSLRHLGKSVFHVEGNLDLGALEIILRTLASEMTFRVSVITCSAEEYQ